MASEESDQEEDSLIFHDEIELEDFEYDEDEETYYYPCPCGDRFQITKEELEAGEEVAECPSCSLKVKVIYDADDFIAGEQKISEAISKVKITA